MQLIAVGKGLFTQVDNEDWAEFQALCSWCLNANGHVTGSARKKHFFLHTLVYRNIDPSYIGEVDHEDRDPLNNQRYNLRPATRSQNNANGSIRVDNTSGFRGVCWRESHQKWEAFIRIDGKKQYLGLYEDREDAARAYNQAALRLYGQYARINEGV